MSKLEKLIQQYCPDGVEWKMFYDVCDLIRGITYNKSQEAKTETEDAHKVLRANNITLYLNVLNFEDVKLVSKDVVVKPEQHLYAGDILMCAGSGSKEHVGKVAFISENIDYTFGGFMAVVRCKAGILPRYMFHILSSHYFSSHLDVQINSSTINNINKQVMQSFAFPVPPLPVQEEIVRILDTFTELQAELQAELQKRKQQYNFYRDNLLNFKDINRGGQEIKWMKMSDVCNIKGRIGFRGYTRNDQVKRGEGALSLSPSNISNGKMDYSKGTYITWTKYDESPEIQTFNGDIIFCKTASIGKVAFVTNLPCKATINPQLVVLKDIKCSARFLSYYLETNYIQNIVMSLAGIGSVPNISQKALSDILIPIPPLAEQNRIVSILDRFDTLTNDLTSGLPAEMEKRRQQYEFYRDKLLTFKRKEA